MLGQTSLDLDEIKDALEEIVHEDNRAGEVIHRLRHLLKKGEQKLESVNINDLVRSTTALLHSELIGRETGVGRDWKTGYYCDGRFNFNCNRSCLIL